MVRVVLTGLLTCFGEGSRFPHAPQGLHPNELICQAFGCQAISSLLRFTFSLCLTLNKQVSVSFFVFNI